MLRCAVVQALWHQDATVLMDNSACYKSRKFRQACRELGIRHKRTKPYPPK
ncbi:MAG: transposase family protein [Desulfovibrio sp.]|nr:transposase family protein [Desulfovibrio sp.]